MIIIKIGGGKNINIGGILDGLPLLKEPVIIVHGANTWRDELAEKLQLEKQVVTSVSGFDSVLTDEAGIDLLLMAYAGLRNKRIVELCRMRGLPAIGLTGLDGGMIQGRRNPGIKVRENGKVFLRRDLSGKPREVNLRLLSLLLEEGYLPVLTVPIADENGQAVNTENDDVVALLHDRLKARLVISFLEAGGLLADAGDPGSVIPAMTPVEVLGWEDRSQGRIKRKLHAINKLYRSGPVRVILADGRRERPLHDALAGKGTLIQ